MAALFNAGLSLSKILELLEGKIQGLDLKKIRSGLEQGGGLAESLGSLGLERSLQNLVSVGERSGDLGGVLDRAADLLDKRQSFRRNLRQALTYPAFILIACSFSILGLFVFILPVFASMFSDFNYSLPLITRVLIGLPNYWPVMLSGLALLIWFAIKIKTSDRLKHKLPVFNQIHRHTQVSYFARTLGSQIKSGISILNALELTASGADLIYRNAINDIKLRVENGEKLASALSSFPALFPHTFDQMVAVGEETGSLDTLLLRAADYYESEVEQAVKRAALLIEPASTLAVGLIVGVVAFAMIMPLFSIMNSLL
ncbi:type II secretion system F family protein [Candidatus Saganbacteria bacterium]|nr:type II secretion system F family protein [Candidatus Saganbacteria bacterium]